MPLRDFGSRFGEALSIDPYGWLHGAMSRELNARRKGKVNGEGNAESDGCRGLGLASGNTEV